MAAKLKDKPDQGIPSHYHHTQVPPPNIYLQSCPIHHAYLEY